MSLSLSLSLENLCTEAEKFSQMETNHQEPSLFGVTDGKAVGTYLELKFRNFLVSRGYKFTPGNAASGLDFPDLNVDMKVTSIRQPQSSSPFRSLGQKIYGLGYSLLVFVYDKKDDPHTRTATLNITDTVFIEAPYTADHSMTSGLLALLDSGADAPALAAFMRDKKLTADESELLRWANEVLEKRPIQGSLTISPAMQWRLQYARPIGQAGTNLGINSVYKAN